MVKHTIPKTEGDKGFHWCSLVFMQTLLPPFALQEGRGVKQNKLIQKREWNCRAN